MRRHAFVTVANIPLLAEYDFETPDTVLDVEVYPVVEAKRIRREFVGTAPLNPLLDEDGWGRVISAVIAAEMNGDAADGSAASEIEAKLDSPRFTYVPAAHTDIRATFEENRRREEERRLKAMQRAHGPVPMAPTKEGT